MFCTKCDKKTVGKSKYCREHRQESRRNFKAMLSEKADEKKARLDKIESAIKQAMAEGRKAGDAWTPTPMVVEQRKNVMDDNSPVVQQWNVPSGLCGFGWVDVYVKPNTIEGKWLKEEYNAYKPYGVKGCVRISIHNFGQSYEKKLAMAKKVASVLEAHDINASYGGRLD